MKYFHIFFLFIVFSFQQFSYSQITKDIETDFDSFISTGGDIACGLFQFDKSTQINFAGSLLTIDAGYSLDNNAKDFALDNRNHFNDGLFSIDKVYGSKYTLIGIGAIYGYGLFFHDKDIRKVGLQTIEAVGYAGVITTILKSVVGRSRPYANEGKARFRPFNVNAAHTSFPSGHSTVAFAVSTVLANNTNNLLLKIIYYGASTLVDGARIYHNAHWLSDTIVGSAIGYFVGDFVSKPEMETKKDDKRFSFNVGINTINLIYKF